ncbi:hypothetical protein Z969_01345 [Clostridium novyi A str. 4570]|uniref:Uncharacterized protein n=1 Tax=Clostridium novyi A str. 4570 TaxID=1444290 RepID=A0AA88ZU99_CLONO|nr:DUF5685 family protein [Clostridium novyi]KGN03268.1 hypothetical protein Z969_01345 [Clostridium novyi A str. 4570]
MFGYVFPYKMELKIKDYEKFKAYYCGLCLSLKNNFGNLPRLSLNYDMTFLAILLDSLDKTKTHYNNHTCIVHPIKKRIFVVNNKALDYAAFCNVCLTYYKLLDDYNDDNSLQSKLISLILKKYLKKQPNYNELKIYIEKKLNQLNSLEKNPQNKNLDEFAHPFADLTGFIISYYIDNTDYKLDLYWLGYNLGKWIYIIDAYDDLEKDMKSHKFNPIDLCINKDNLPYSELIKVISSRIDFILCNCARECYSYFQNLPIEKNYDLLENILHYGLLEKMNIIFKRSESDNEKSL